MKLLLQTLHVVTAVQLQKTNVLFDGEAKTYTQAELDEIKRTTADASFKAGQAKASKDKEAEAQTEELETLRKDKTEREAKELLGTITTGLSGEELKDTGLVAKGLFAQNYKDRLKDKTGKALAGEVTKIRNELVKSKDEETLQAFFGKAVSIDADGAFKRAVELNGKKGKETKGLDDQFQGDSIFRKR